jgi:hypothetical protein
VTPGPIVIESKGYPLIESNGENNVSKKIPSYNDIAGHIEKNTEIQDFNIAEDSLDNDSYGMFPSFNNDIDVHRSGIEKVKLSSERYIYGRYIYGYVCMYIYVYTYTYIYMYIHIYIHIYIYIYMYVYTCIYMYMYTRIYVCVHIHVDISLHIHMYMEDN